MLLRRLARANAPVTDAPAPIQSANPSKHNGFPQFTGPSLDSYFDCGRRSTTKRAIQRRLSRFRVITGQIAAYSPNLERNNLYEPSAEKRERIGLFAQVSAMCGRGGSEFRSKINSISECQSRGSPAVRQAHQACRQSNWGKPIFVGAALKSDPEYRQQPLQYRRQTHQYHQNFEQIRQPPITDEPVNQPEQDRSDDHRDQDLY
jgi:hypothetical protein